VRGLCACCCSSGCDRFGLFADPADDQRSRSLVGSCGRLDMRRGKRGLCLRAGANAESARIACHVGRALPPHGTVDGCYFFVVVAVGSGVLRSLRVGASGFRLAWIRVFRQEEV